MQILLFLLAKIYCVRICITHIRTHNMINMKLKSKCNQMLELFVCAFAVNVRICMRVWV